jgi:7SK snRNA methylphosphate capping enzyme
VAPSERAEARRAVAALAQTWFVHGDFAAGEAAAGSVDTVTALSVTKWVHLHTGDAGLRAFFAKVHALLAPGGYFVLEPQPWRSYRAAASKARRQGLDPAALPRDAFFHRTEALELRPEAFPDVLCDEFGFRLVRRLQPPAATAAGFDRALYLFRKPS